MDSLMIIVGVIRMIDVEWLACKTDSKTCLGIAVADLLWPVGRYQLNIRRSVLAAADYFVHYSNFHRQSYVILCVEFFCFRKFSIKNGLVFLHKFLLENCVNISTWWCVLYLGAYIVATLIIGVLEMQ